MTLMKAAIAGLATALLVFDDAGLAAPSAQAAPCPAENPASTTSGPARVRLLAGHALALRPAGISSPVFQRVSH